MKNTPFILIIIIVTVLAGRARALSAAGTQDAETVHMQVRRMAAAAQAGDAEALYQMSRLHLAGYDTVPRDTVRANALLHEAAQRGLPKAQNLYGFRLFNGTNGLTPDRTAGLQWIEKAALAGMPEAESNLGFMLLAGEDVQKDYDKAFFWLSRAAGRGVPEAHSMLGDLYRDGHGVAPDTLVAEGHYRQALMAGLPDAGWRLEALKRSDWQSMPPHELMPEAVWLYTHGAPAVAIPLFERINSEGDGQVAAQAAALLGDAWSRGVGVPHNSAKGLQWLLRAAAAGYAPAQFILGEHLEMYPDDGAALGLTPSELFEAAALQGVNDAASAMRILTAPPAQ